MDSCQAINCSILLSPRLLPLLILLLVSSCVSVAAAEDVVALTPDTFEKEVGKDKDALVEFYAPWYALLRPIHFNFSIVAVKISIFILT